MLVAVGLALIAGVETKHHLGLGLAICGAALAAIFPVLNRKFVLAGIAPETLLIWEMPGACLTALLVHPLFASYGSLLQWQGLDWLWMFFMAVVCTVFGHAFHSHLLRHITAYASNLAMNFEPVHGILLGALIFHDYRALQPTFYLGAFTIIVANFCICGKSPLYPNVPIEAESLALGIDQIFLTASANRSKLHPLFILNNFYLLLLLRCNPALNQIVMFVAQILRQSQPHENFSSFLQNQQPKHIKNNEMCGVFIICSRM